MPDTDLRRKVLEQAAEIISGSRHKDYGGAEDSFNSIARYWNVHLFNRYGVTVDLDAVDVALMMDLLKTARLDVNPAHADSWTDKAGYVGCGYEIALTNERFRVVMEDLDLLEEEDDA